MKKRTLGVLLMAGMMALNGMAVSAQEIMSTGPNGETATLATELSLTDEEIEQVKAGGYTAAILK